MQLRRCAEMDWEQVIAELQGRGCFLFYFFLLDKDKLGSQSYREKCDHSYAKRGEITHPETRPPQGFTLTS